MPESENPKVEIFGVGHFEYMEYILNAPEGTMISVGDALVRCEFCSRLHRPDKDEHRCGMEK